MLLKQVVDKGATLAWSPLRHMPHAFVTGTKEGGGGGFSDYGGELCIHQFDVSQPTTECRTTASLKTPSRFSSVAWGAQTARQTLSHGLIAGGMADGAVSIWDAKAILSGSRDAVVTIPRHQSAVRALQFNPNPAAEHLLAAGSVDGDISIINLDSPTTPVLASPLGAGQRLETEITSLAWNTSVHHILATATVNGVVVVWDLKENKPWCHLRDPHRASISDIAWNPDDGLYLVTACDDDARPVLRVWDLRSSTTTPLCELAGGHTKGLLSVDWCPWDPNLLVTCGKDAHTFVWDIQQGRPVAEIPAGGTAAPAPSIHAGVGSYDGPGPGAHSTHASVFGAPPGGGFGHGAGPSDALSIFGSLGGSAGAGGSSGATLGGLGASAGRRYLTRWSKQAPGLVASCSFDRCVAVHSVVAMGPGVAPKSTPAHIASSPEATLRRAPRWLRRPVGATFSFGGKLVSFAAPQAAAKAELRVGVVPYAKRLQLSSVTTNHDFVSRALEFESALTGLEAGTLDPRSLCDTKSAEAAARGATTTAAAWTFMRMLFEPDARQRVLAHVGYDGATIAAELSRYNKQPVSTPPEPIVTPSEIEQSQSPQQHDAPTPTVWGGFPVPQEGTASAATASELFGSNGARGAVRADDFFSASTPSAAPESGAVESADVAAPEMEAQPSVPPQALADAEPPGDPLATYERRRVPSAADDDVLKRALLVGDFASAVSVCFEQSRFADALLLASCGSADVWAAAKDEYFRRRASPLTAALSAVVRCDFANFVASTPLSDWRDILGLLCTYAKPDEFSGLCEALGDRLATESGDLQSACTVYMAALCTSKAISIWVREARTLARGSLAAEGFALQELVEKSCVLRHAMYVATGVPPLHGVQPEAADLAQYCALLANEGFLPTAGFFAARVLDEGDSPLPAGATLRLRLSRAFSNVDFAYPCAQALAHSPEPYTVSNIGPAPLPVTHQSYSSHTHAAEHAPQSYGHNHTAGYDGHSVLEHNTSRLSAPAHPHAQVHAPIDSRMPHHGLSTATAPAAVVRAPAATSGGHYSSAGVSAPLPPQQQQQQRAIPPVVPPAVPAHAPGPHTAAHLPSNIPPRAPATSATPAPDKPMSFSGFNTGMLQQPSPAPVAAVVAPAPAPAAIPISPEMQAALHSLAGTASALGTLPLTATEQRQLQDAQKALGIIQSKLHEGRVSGDAAAKLCILASQCAAYDFHGAQKTQTELASIDWAQTKDWLRGVRGMVSLALIKSAGGAGTR